MNQKFLKALLTSGMLILLSLFAINCGDSGNESDPVNPSWHTVFSDDFNTSDGSLSSDWSVSTATNASLLISGNQALYTSSAATNDDINCRYINNINTTKLKLTSKIITGSNIANMEYAGFEFKPYPDNQYHYTLTLSKSYLAILKINTSISSNDVLDSAALNLPDNTAYYLELDVDGSIFTGYLKDANGNVLYTLNTTETEFSTWNVRFIFGSNGAATFIFDDFMIEAYN